ncbi:hypothetical protein SELMODRAFT_428974 [Selaginella moellendorffii]|uniref:F-box domain-containing protein n=1 Tax=Selaginella moellendorffii TaxID=88036 RepID=D8T4M5_SELML|nr:hypothetical protein SELMODRAFT_432555 [Selaginella moellendorffii]EFJ08444.1 hypothetical protein SELMODRAFT_428974 [Selaginella moellendorffii]
MPPHPGLPDVLWFYILSKLLDVESLVRASLVCREWNGFVRREGNDIKQRCNSPLLFLQVELRRLACFNPKSGQLYDPNTFFLPPEVSVSLSSIPVASSNGWVLWRYYTKEDMVSLVINNPLVRSSSVTLPHCHDVLTEDWIEPENFAVLAAKDGSSFCISFVVFGTIYAYAYTAGGHDHDQNEWRTVGNGRYRGHRVAWTDFEHCHILGESGHWVYKPQNDECVLVGKLESLEDYKYGAFGLVSLRGELVTVRFMNGPMRLSLVKRVDGFVKEEEKWVCAEIVPYRRKKVFICSDNEFHHVPWNQTVLDLKTGVWKVEKLVTPVKFKWCPLMKETDEAQPWPKDWPMSHTLAFVPNPKI